jgi:hypothetical protein
MRKLAQELHDIQSNVIQSLALGCDLEIEDNFSMRNALEGFDRFMQVYLVDWTPGANMAVETAGKPPAQNCKIWRAGVHRWA